MASPGKVRALAVAAAIGMMAVACTQDAGVQIEVTPTDRTPVGSPPEGSPANEPEIRVEGMRLVGNVPGSDGTFAFWGDLAVVNHWEDSGTPSADDGFVVVDVSDPAHPTQVSRFRCVASYNDISIWDDLVIVSQNEATAGDGCDATPTKAKDPDAFAGLRVISIADPEHPAPLAAVATGIVETRWGRFVRGSHTHTLVPDLEHRDVNGNPTPRLIVYSADGYQFGVKPHATIVEVPLDDPTESRRHRHDRQRDRPAMPRHDACSSPEGSWPVPRMKPG